MILVINTSAILYKSLPVCTFSIQPELGHYHCMLGFFLVLKPASSKSCYDVSVRSILAVFEKNLLPVVFLELFFIFSTELDAEVALSFVVFLDTWWALFSWFNEKHVLTIVSLRILNKYLVKTVKVNLWKRDRPVL